jgi:prophage regulatory protein
MRVLRLDAVVQVTGLGRSTIYKLIGTGEFPSPVPLTGRSVGWLQSEVRSWIRSRVDLRGDALTACAVCGRKGSGD